MKWIIRKDLAMPTAPWKVVGWTWIEELDEWVSVHSWQPTHAAAVAAMDSFKPRRPSWEVPC